MSPNGLKMTTEYLEVDDYYRAERNALLELLDKSAKKIDLRKDKKILWSEREIYQNEEFNREMRSRLVMNLIHDFEMFLVDEQIVTFETRIDKTDGEPVITARLNFDILINADQFKSQMKSAIEDLTEYEDV